MADIQKPATTIKIGAGDPLYLSFLPALDTAMVAAWHQPKVGFPLDLVGFPCCCGKNHRRVPGACLISRQDETYLKSSLRVTDQPPPWVFEGSTCVRLLLASFCVHGRRDTFRTYAVLTGSYRGLVFY